MTDPEPTDDGRTGDDVLARPDPQGALLLLEADADTLAAATYRWRTSGRAVRVVRGGKTRTYDGLMDELGAALQLPLYFGGSWPALAECLADLEWVDPSTGLVVVVAHADEVLADDPVELGALVRALGGAVRSWATPIEQGEWWDRPAVPVHVVLHHAPGTDPAPRYEEAGAALRRLG